MPSASTPLDASMIRLHHAGHGPPLVLLHCLGVDRHFWDFCAYLARDFTLLRYDFPGHGEAAVPAARYRIEDLAAQRSEERRVGKGGSRESCGDSGAEA